MMANGRDEGAGNVRKVEGWISERNRLRDWDGWKSRGRINRSLLAEELDFGRSVTTQNPGVRGLLEKQDKVWFNAEPGNKDAQIAAQEASIERTRGKLQTATSDNNKHFARIAELEAEVRRLEKKLDKYEKLHGLIETGDPGCKI